MTAVVRRAADGGGKSPILVPEFLDGLGEVPAVADLLWSFVRSMQAAGLAETTIVDRVELLGRVARQFGHLFGLTAEQISEFLADPGFARWSRATYFMCLRSFYRWAADTELLTRSPMAKMPRPKVGRGIPRPASLETFHQLLAGPEPWATAVALAGYAGLRIMEICRLRREDVTQEQIRVMGKGGKEAVLPTHPLLWPRLCDRPPGLLVPNQSGEAFSRSGTATSAFNRHVRRMGLPGVTMHKFRHLYGTMLLRQTGGNLRLVQELMRHSSPATTAIYTLVTDDERTAAIRQLNLGEQVEPEPGPEPADR